MGIRVLHVVSGLDYGGIEIFLKNILPQLERYNLEISILSTSPKHGALEDFFSARYKVYHLDDDSTRSARKKGRIAFFSAHKNEFDIVHIHTVFTTAYSIAAIAKKYQQAKIVMHSHIAADYSLAMKVKNVLARGLLNKYTDVPVACSSNSAVFLFGKKRAKNATVIKNAINTEAYRFDETARAEVRRELCISDDCFVLGNVGRLSNQKNQCFLVKIFAEYKKQNPDSKLVIIGEGDKRREIEAEIASANLSGDVILTGARGDISRVLNAFDCFALPSLFEGLAISAVEAQANGLKCYISDTVTTDINIGSRCVFLPIDSATAWTSAVINSKNDREDVSRQIIDSGYEISQSADMLYSVYKNACE